MEFYHLECLDFIAFLMRFDKSMFFFFLLKYQNAKSRTFRISLRD